MLGNAITRKSQVDLTLTTTRSYPLTNGDTMVAAAGLFAPTIRYHNGTFYIACTNVGEEGEDFEAGNFYIYSKDIMAADSWSDVIPLALHGIDPSIFIDPTDGRAYVTGSWRLPRSEQPTSTIKQWEIDLATGKELSEIREIWGGHSQIYTEGPHMYLKDGWYYLLVAEGGTFEHHHLSLARSRSVWGPFEPCPHNPVLTSYGTSEPIRDAGHGELFQDVEGRWWAACLAVRKGKDGNSTRYPLGRESFLTPVSWPEGEWPTIEHPRLTFRREAPRSKAQRYIDKPGPEVGDCYIRFHEKENFKWDTAKSGSARRDVQLRASKTDLSVGVGSATFTGQRQRRLVGSSVSATLELGGLHGARRPLRAGVTVYKDDLRYATIGVEAGTTASGEVKVVLDARNNAPVRRVALAAAALAADVEAVELLVTAKGDSYEFSYREKRRDGSLAELAALGEVDAKEFTERDFTGTLFGIYATEEGDDVPESDRNWVSFRAYEVDA